MYSITQSPTAAVELAHAIMDERLRNATTTGRVRVRPASGRRLHLPHPTWRTRPVVAV